MKWSLSLNCFSSYIQKNELQVLESQGDKEVLEQRFNEEIGSQQQHGRVRGYGRTVTVTKLKEISVEKRIEQEVESHKKSLDETMNAKLNQWSERIAIGLNGAVKLLQTTNPDMVIPDNLFDNLFGQKCSPSDASSALPRTQRDEGPSSRGTSSPVQGLNEDAGNSSPTMG